MYSLSRNGSSAKGKRYKSGLLDLAKQVVKIVDVFEKGRNKKLFKLKIRAVIRIDITIYYIKQSKLTDEKEFVMEDKTNYSALKAELFKYYWQKYSLCK